MPITVDLEYQQPAEAFAAQRMMLENILTKPLRAETEIFESRDKVCACIDEGTHGDVRFAGAGILDPEGFEHVVEVMRKAGVEKVTSHEDCGAVKAAATKALGPEATAEQIRHFGIDWAKQVAAALGVEHEHLTEIDRPEHHDATVICIAPPGFHPERLPADWPKSMVISALAEEDELVASQAALAAKILLSPDGLYHDQFSNDTPLHVIIIGQKNDDQRHHLVEAVHGALKEFGARVHLDHITVEAETKPVEADHYGS